MGNRAADIDSKPQVLTPDVNPFPVPYATRVTKMFWNFSEYGHLLNSEFFERGGKIVMRDFHHPDELAHLPEKVIINCPGYAAHDWWKDKAMIPVRGQTETGGGFGLLFIAFHLGLALAYYEERVKPNN